MVFSKTKMLASDAVARQNPRWSSPLSFQPKLVFCMLYAVFLLTFCSSVTANCISVSDYDSTVDYFPVKVSSRNTRDFKIEYFNHYKVITNEQLGITYIAYLCGTPVPSKTAATDVLVQIPPANIGLDSTTVVGLFNSLGYLENVNHLSAPYIVDPECLDATYNVNKTWTTADDGDSTYVLEEANTPDILFTDGDEQINQNDWPAGSVEVKYSVTKSLSGDLQFQWINYFAAFLNEEEKAVKAVQVHDQLMACTNFVGSRNKNILWVSNFYGTNDNPVVYSTGTSPTYYSDSIYRTGGNMVLPLGESGKSKEELIAALENNNEPIDYIIIAGTADHGFMKNVTNDDFVDFWDNGIIPAVNRINQEKDTGNVKVYDFGIPSGDWFYLNNLYPVVVDIELKNIMEENPSKLEIFHQYYPTNEKPLYPFTADSYASNAKECFSDGAVLPEPVETFLNTCLNTVNKVSYGVMTSVVLVTVAFFI